MASSIIKGIKKLSKKTDSFFISLGDMPSINYDTYNQLIKCNKNKKWLQNFMEKKIHIDKYDII